MADWRSYKLSRKVYLVDGRRTPFGKFGGSLKGLSPVDLSESCSKSLFQELNLSPTLIDHVVFASVIPTTTDTLYAGRHLALRLGAKESTPGYNVNRLCGSGFQAIADAYHMILRDEASSVLVSGSENMSNTPHLIYGSRFGTKYGNLKSEDLLLDSLTDKFSQTPMGITAENLAEKYGISRDAAERFSVESHQKAAVASKANFLENEISAIDLEKVKLKNDEHIREDVSIEDMQKLRTSFKKGGTVTPATASGIVDGAASVLVASEKFVEEHSLQVLAEIVDFDVVGVDPKIMGIGPVPAIRNILEKNNLKQDEIDVFEVNEAFASQALACNKELNIPIEKLNPWGGAIAYGHPLAATGIRVSLTAAKQLNKNSQKLAIASACIGGGQGFSILLKRP